MEPQSQTPTPQGPFPSEGLIPSPSSGRLRMLLVEDNPGDIRLIRECLMEAGETDALIDTAETLDQAVAMISAKIAGPEDAPIPGYDVILLDLSLPDSIGIDTVNQIRPVIGESPVIVLTGLDDEATAISAIREGAQDYLLKSGLEAVLLKRTIRHAIERQKLVLELRAANQKIREQQESLIEDERLKVLLQISGASAHELRQPLTILTGYIELMREDIEDPEALATYLREVQTSAERITRIVERFQEIRADIRLLPKEKDLDTRIEEPLGILSVEDSDRDYEAIQKALASESKVTIRQARTVSEGLAAVLQHTPDLVLLDYQLPDATGFDFLQEIRGHGVEVPVVVVTRQGNEIVASEFLKQGVYDYLPKDFLNHGSLVRCIRNAVEKFQLMGEIRNAREKMAELSIRDDLTGLYNRRHLLDELGQEISRTHRYGRKLSVCMVDIDHFKTVNDTYGHPTGDTVLTAIGARIREEIRRIDVAGRYGGEEMMLMLPETGQSDAFELCDRLRRKVADTRFFHQGQTFSVTVSIGVAEFIPGKTDTAEKIVQAADQALYLAKDAGRNRVVRDAG